MARTIPLLLAGALGLLSSCAGAGAADDGNLTRIERSESPAELAVLPVVVEAHGLVPDGEIRDVAHERLVARGFSPLSQRYVDARVNEAEEASMARLTGAGALQIRVLGWAGRRADSQGRIRYEVEAEMRTEAGARVGLVRRKGTEKLSEQELSSTPASARERLLVERIVAALIEPFPGPPPL